MGIQKGASHQKKPNTAGKATVNKSFTPRKANSKSGNIQKSARVAAQKQAKRMAAAKKRHSTRGTAI